jgi:hypothetical protein
MPPTRIRFKFQGTDVEGVPIGIANTHENWNEVLLDDGTTLRMKTVITDVLRIEEPPMADAEGNPVYVVKSANIVRANSPATLKRTHPDG